MAGIPWTEQEVEILRKMAEAGKSVDDIAAVLVSRTVCSVEKKASELRVSLAGRTEIDVAAFNQIMGETWKPRVAE